ncbi:probable disease resistance protein At5g66900 [Rosa rugosa]|uniref:probable disease resistance protein At5g66900 n=1 Tax=Rosa rugosa TaxID=74645 RepID=UPI002B401337|nr:probable disease resistance protein At5g66900 [Rosa rugosa]
MVGGGDVFGGAAGGLLFNVLYDVLKELISKSMIYRPLLQNILSALDSYGPLIKQIEASNEELGLPQEEVANFKAHMENGIEIVRKCSKVRKWNIYKKYKYANKLLGWESALVRQLNLLKAQGVRDGKKTLVSVKTIERVVTGIETSSIFLEAEVEHIAATSRHMEKALSGVEMISEDIVEGMYRIEDRVETSSSIVEAGLKRIEDQLETRNGAKVGAWGVVPELAQFTVGLDEPLKELKMKLLKEDGVSMLVVTAPGGCGKTTLATKFCQDEQVKDKFKNNIFFVTVSNTPNLSLIVQELYQRKGSQVPTFQNEITAVKWLQTFLKEEGQNPLLLVLDDVWSGSESLLDKFQFEMPDYKILVTSRSEFPRFGSSYHLRSLDYDNAMKLFHHSASLGDKSSHIPEYLSSRIVKGCKGFPLAITVAGGSLCGQRIEIWQQILIEWSKGSSILDSETTLLLRLQSSLVVSDSDKEMAIIRKCFLDLASFPEDQRIPVTALIDMWTESYDQLDEDILCVAYLQRLTNRSLANLVVTRKDQSLGDGYYSEHFVTQHDLLRELAIYETKQLDPGHRERLIINISGDNFPKWWSEKKHESLKARLLSISTDGNFSSKWHHMELPYAEVLVLNFQTKNYALPKFVDTARKLKVLVVTNYGFSPAELSNIPLLGSLSHLKRIRLERVSIPSMSKNPIQLVGLKKISLFMCTIGKAFSDGSIQISYAFPSLEEISIDYCNDLVEMPADVCDLSHLRNLSITNSHKLLALPEEIGKLEKLELLRLRSCTDLAQLPGSSRNLKKLIFLDISYCFSIKVLPGDIGEMSSLRKLNMRECSRLQEVPVSVLDLEHLEEVICDDETRNLWEPFLPLGNTRIVVEKETVNLNWLHKLQS